jgi:small redox-active disulfide protein 2
MLKIKVLGPGCANCHRVAEIVEEAAAEMGLEVEIEMVTDRVEFARYNLLATPGLVIDDKLVVGGRIPGLDEVKTLLGRAVKIGA